MRFSRVAQAGACALALAAAMALVEPARANPHSIALGAAPGFSAVRTTFVQQRCAAALVSSPSNGTDARIIDASGLAGFWANVGWQGTKLVPNDSSYLTAAFIDGNCLVTGSSPASPGAANPGSWQFFVPHGTRWLVVEAAKVANISFSINRL